MTLSIIANGKEYRTLLDTMLVDGKKVYAVYVNGKQVYPSEEIDDDKKKLYFIRFSNSGLKTKSFYDFDLGTINVTCEYSYSIIINTCLYSLFNELEIYEPSRVLLEYHNTRFTDIIENVRLRFYAEPEIVGSNSMASYDRMWVSALNKGISGDFTFDRIPFSFGPLNAFGFGLDHEPSALDPSFHAVCPYGIIDLGASAGHIDYKNFIMNDWPVPPVITDLNPRQDELDINKHPAPKVW